MNTRVSQTLVTTDNFSWENLFKKKDRKKKSNLEESIEKNNIQQTSEISQGKVVKEGTVEFWNEERARLGLKPLKEW